MCYDDNARPPLPPWEAGAAHGEDIVLTAADGNRFAAFTATPEATPSAQVVIYPDVRGLHQFYKDLAVRFAEQGTAAIAIDYFGRTAGLTPRDDSFEYMPHVQQMRGEGFFADVQAALDHLHANGGAERATFTVGFCRGGSLSFLSGMRDLPLTAIIGFYAGLSRDIMDSGTVLEQAARVRYPALGLFGGADQGIPVEQVEALDRQLDVAGAEHEIVIYPDAPHSFFDRRAEQYAEASSDAWRRVLSFIAAHTKA